jgi:RNA polymerase sporulation-specific sigma factor
MVKTTEAQQALCLDNMKLVSHCVKGFLPSGLPWEELRACGNLGLVQAAATFLPEKNISFSTYASTCIHHEICKLLRQHKKHRVVTESLDDILAGTESMRLYDVLPDDTDLMETVDRKLLAADIIDALRALPPKQREVWELRLGLTGEPPMKQREIAVRLGCSRARISKILQDSSEKITRGAL